MTVNPEDADSFGRDPLAAGDPLAAMPLENGRLDPSLRPRRDQAVLATAPLLRSRRALNALRQLELVCEGDHRLLDVVRTPTAGLVVVANVLHRAWLRGEEVDEEGLDFREFDKDVRHRRWKLVDVLVAPTSWMPGTHLPAACSCDFRRQVPIEDVIGEVQRRTGTGSKKRRVVLA